MQGRVAKAWLSARFRRATAAHENPVHVAPHLAPGAEAGTTRTEHMSLLQQKDGFSELDRELFAMLGGHAAAAIFAARLHSQSRRKLDTIQGFIDLLAD